VAHFLGVDHAGHTFGVDSAPMAAKLAQLDAVIARTAATLAADASHADTLLLVLGDHGMTWAGDHGGGSEEETHSALFALRPGAAARARGAQEVRERVKVGREALLPQIDFAPTLALLLGVPPPYGSVGRVSGALWAAAGGGDGGFAAARRANAWQVARALRAYAEAGAFAPADVAAVQRLYAAAAAATDAESAARGEDAFLSAAAALARAQWTAFRAAPMAAGLAVLLATLGAHAAALRAALPPADATADAWAPMAGAALAIAAAHTACVFSVGAMQLEAAAAHVPMTAFAVAHAALCAWRVLRAPAKARAPVFARLLEACALLLVTAAIAAAAMPGEDKPADAGAADAAAAARWLHPAALTAARTYLPLLLLPRALLPRRDSGRARSASHTLLAAAVWACHAAVGAHWAAAAAVTAGWSVPASAAHAARIALPRAVYAGAAVAACAALRAARSSGGGDGGDSRTSAAAAASRGVLAALSAPLLLLTGRAAPLLAALAGAQGALLLRAHAHPPGGAPPPPPLLRRWALLSAACASHFAALQLFAATGHRSAFEALHFKAAFTGFDDFGFGRQGALLAANTWSSELAAVCALPLVAARIAASAACGDGGDDEVEAFWRSLRALLAARGLLRAAGAGASAAAAAVLRRHLHVWALFAPKFVFEAAGLLLTDALALAAVAVAAAGAAGRARKAHTA
jgi:phosphatidylinositol glycan class O